MIDKATVVYQIDGATKTMIVEGGHVSIQMGPHFTIVQVAERFGAEVNRVHMFRCAEYVDVERRMSNDD